MEIFESLLVDFTVYKIKMQELLMHEKLASLHSSPYPLARRARVTEERESGVKGERHGIGGDPFSLRTEPNIEMSMKDRMLLG